MNPNDFVTDEAKAAEQLDDQIFHASGARGQTGMAPYPLYGLGTETEVATPFYRRPWFCYSVGGAVGFGAGWAFFTWGWPMIQKYRKKVRRNKAKSTSEE